jgi:hypothetical protein
MSRKNTDRLDAFPQHFIGAGSFGSGPTAFSNFPNQLNLRLCPYAWCSAVNAESSYPLAGINCGRQVFCTLRGRYSVDGLIARRAGVVGVDRRP